MKMFRTPVRQMFTRTLATPESPAATSTSGFRSKSFRRRPIANMFPSQTPTNGSARHSKCSLKGHRLLRRPCVSLYRSYSPPQRSSLPRRRVSRLTNLVKKKSLLCEPCGGFRVLIDFSNNDGERRYRSCSNKHTRRREARGPSIRTFPGAELRLYFLLLLQKVSPKTICLHLRMHLPPGHLVVAHFCLGPVRSPDVARAAPTASKSIR